MSNTTKLKILTILSGVFERARKLYKLPRNPMADVEKPGQRVNSDIDVFTPVSYTHLTLPTICSV